MSSVQPAPTCRHGQQPWPPRTRACLILPATLIQDTVITADTCSSTGLTHHGAHSSQGSLTQFEDVTSNIFTHEAHSSWGTLTHHEDVRAICTRPYIVCRKVPRVQRRGVAFVITRSEEVGPQAPRERLDRAVGPQRQADSLS